MNKTLATVSAFECQITLMRQTISLKISSDRFPFDGRLPPKDQGKHRSFWFRNDRVFVERGFPDQVRDQERIGWKNRKTLSHSLLNTIQNWFWLNHLHFQVPHFDQSKFHWMLRFSDRHVFMAVNHFHQFHLNQIRDWFELNHLLFHVVTWINWNSTEWWNSWIIMFLIL
jgi:hypothetical protein